MDLRSDCTFCFSLKQKSDKFIANIASYGKIKVIQINNGGEYICEFNNLLIKNKAYFNMSIFTTPTGLDKLHTW